MSEMGLPPMVTLISNAGRLPTACFCLMFRLLPVMRLMEIVMSVPLAFTFFSPSIFASSLIDVPLARTISRSFASLSGSFTASAICFTTLEGSFTLSTFFSTEKSMVTTPFLAVSSITVSSLERSTFLMVAVLPLTTAST